MNLANGNLHISVWHFNDNRLDHGPWHLPMIYKDQNFTAKQQIRWIRNLDGNKLCLIYRLSDWKCLRHKDLARFPRNLHWGVK